MKYPIAEKFKAVQGEGLYTGTPMAFIRFVGCSVGKEICHGCDTDFDKVLPELGGGMFEAFELLQWIGNYRHICFTGGEPLDRNLGALLDLWVDAGVDNSFDMVHVETSGTRPIPDWVVDGQNADMLHLTVSPKPGYRADAIYHADEIKVIIGGLGNGEGWPTLEDALKWAQTGKPVYLQPHNHKNVIWQSHMAEAVQLVKMNPTLRLSAQLHKFLHER